MKRFPLFTLLLCTLAGTLMLLPPAVHDILYFNYDHLQTGRWWGLITGHWLHTDIHHLCWNTSALAILGTMIEQRSRTLLLVSIAVGIISVDLLLLSPASDLLRYCGLSGLLNTLLGVVLYLCWRETRSKLVLLTGALSVMKIALEMYSGQSIFTEIAWPPIATAHLAGILGAPLAVMVWARKKRKRRYLNNNKENHHEHLVAN